MTLSSMEMEANTNATKVENKDEKQGNAQGSSWGFLSWFKSNNPKKEKEDPTASVKEQLKIEELEKLKRKGDLLRAAQRRESERTLQKNIPSNIKPEGDEVQIDTVLEDTLVCKDD